MLALGMGLAAAVIWAVHDFLARKLSQGAALLPIVVVVLAAGVGALIVPALAFGDWAGMTAAAVQAALMAGAAFALAIGTLYRAFSMAPARVVSPIIGAYPVLSLVLSVWGGRGVTGWDWVSVLLVVLGIAVVSLTCEAGEKQGRPLPAMGWAALSAFGFAATFALGQHAARLGPGLPVIVITRLAALAVIGALFAAHRGSFAGLRGNFVVLCAMGAADALALGLVTASGSLPFAEYASVASSLFGVGTILLAWAFLGEKMRALQWVGVLVVFSGIAVLSAQG